MNRIRQFHLYLGCIFAPLLVFFAITGIWQAFMLHVDHKDGYKAPRLLSTLSQVHVSQRLSTTNHERAPSYPLKCFVVAMAVGFVVTTILGVIMAFKFTRTRWLVWLCLIVGFIAPVLLLYAR